MTSVDGTEQDIAITINGADGPTGPDAVISGDLTASLTEGTGSAFAPVGPAPVLDNDLPIDGGQLSGDGRFVLVKDVDPRILLRKDLSTGAVEPVAVNASGEFG